MKTVLCPSLSPPGNIQVSWIDDTSAFVSLSQAEQVQIGKSPAMLCVKPCLF